MSEEDYEQRGNSIDWTEIKYFAAECIKDTKYLYSQQVDEEIPAYILAYYPEASRDLDKLKKIVREVAEAIYGKTETSSGE